MRKKRLLKLAKLLDRVQQEAPDKFHIGTWMDTVHDAEGFKMLPQRDPNTDQVLGTCCTIACALGWAATLPKFQAKGLHLDRHAYSGSVEYVDENGTEYEGIEAAQAFFGLDRDTSYEIFMPSGYAGHPTAGTVAQKIREIVAEQVLKEMDE